MPRELSPFELDRELARVAPQAQRAYRALRAGREVTLTVPAVLDDAETLERLASDASDPIAAPLVRWLYWLQLMQRALPLEGERVRRYRAERHALDAPVSGQFTWRELLGHALKDEARRPRLLEVLVERGGALADAGARLSELRAAQPSFAGRSRAELELPSPDIAEQAQHFLTQSADAFASLEIRDLAGLLRVGLAQPADDGWPRRLSLRTLHDLLGQPDWMKGLRLTLGDLPAPLSAASFARGLLRLGAAWSDALASTSQPFSLGHDPFGLSRSLHGALLAGLVTEPVFLKRQLGLGKERALSHARALSGAALAFARALCLRVLCAEPALNGTSALREAFSEHGSRALGFEPPPGAAGLLLRPRLGDAQRLAGLWLAAARADEQADEHDEDWFRNPRAIEQLRAEAHLPPAITCTAEALKAGATTYTRKLSERL